MHGVITEELKEDGDAPYKALSLDVDHYQKLLDAPGIPDEQKRLFLEALWSIMVGFVDLGFGVRAEETCGQTSAVTAVRQLAADSVLSSKDRPRALSFNAAAEASNDQQEREET